MDRSQNPESIRHIPIDDTLKMFKRIKFEQSQCELDNPDNMLFVNVFYGIPSNNACNTDIKSKIAI